MTEFHLRALLQLLHDRDVHGFVRGTEDLDLVPDPDPENLERLTADTSFGGLDVVQRAKGVPSYSQLAADAVETELLGIPVRICSLPRLREMKEAQGRALDKADLRTCRRAEAV
ncbi:MAG TPA: hypothetical protein VLK56_02620 [Solirubrobacterales bacterium]|nr:hypothetical protein [Solirubrobacterales bacterium]